MRRTCGKLLYYPNQTFVSRDQHRVQHQWLPRRLLLVRHGESEANVDRTIYSTTPDWRIPLTCRGRAQAFDCGRRLKQIIGEEKLYIYYSPYTRTRQTLEEIRKSLTDSQIQGEREDERLREQEMGNYQPMELMDQTWAARNRFSRLYYRFPFGESSADVGDRVSGFFDSLLRERLGLTVPNMNEGMMEDPAREVSCLSMGRWSGQERPHARGITTIRSYNASGGVDISSSTALSHPRGYDVSNNNNNGGGVGDETISDLGDAMDRGVLPPNSLGAAAGNDQNVVIVSHGLLIRLFVGRWFRVPMEVFETMSNPPNCAIVVLERDDAIGRLIMTDVSKSLFGSDPLLQMMKFDGQEDTQWYRERFLGIINPDKETEDRIAEDDDENHYSLSTAHNIEVGAPAPYRVLRCSASATSSSSMSEPRMESDSCPSNSQQQQRQQHQQECEPETFTKQSVSSSSSGSGDGVSQGGSEDTDKSMASMAGNVTSEAERGSVTGVDTAATEAEKRRLGWWLLKGFW